MSSARLALVTCDQGPGIDDDEPALTAALNAAGAATDIVSWSADIDWSHYDAAIIRSTWDYHDRLDAFLDWTAHAAEQTRLFNPRAAVLANHDKRYLGTLAAGGVPTVPTVFAAPGEAADHTTLPEATEYVVKPTVSAGSQNTHRVPADPGAIAAHVEAVHDFGKSAMIQPYISSVDVRGETGLLFFGGVFSHAFTKSAMLPAEPRATAATVDGLYVDERITAAEPTEAERHAAEDCLDAVTALGLERETLLYARIDLVTDADGTVRLMELELIEPSFFLWTHPSAAVRFADAVTTALGG